MRVNIRIVFASAILCFSRGAYAQDAAFMRDAKEVSRSQGITVKEALRRAKIEAELSAIDDRLTRTDANYAGLYVSASAASYVVHVKHVGQVSALLNRYMAQPTLRGAVVGENAKFTLVELKTAQRRLQSLFATLREESMTYVDVEKGVVIGAVHHPEKLAAQVAGLKLGEKVILRAETQFPSPTAGPGTTAGQNNLAGGNQLVVYDSSGNTNLCTSGFGVRGNSTDGYGSGVTGILTAGHCAKGTRSGLIVGKTMSTQNNTDMNIQAAEWDSSHDISWAVAPFGRILIPATNWISDGNAGRQITAQPVSLPGNGTTMCKYGQLLDMPVPRLPTIMYLERIRTEHRTVRLSS